MALIIGEDPTKVKFDLFISRKERIEMCMKYDTGLGKIRRNEEIGEGELNRCLHQSP